MLTRFKSIVKPFVIGLLVLLGGNQVLAGALPANVVQDLKKKEVPVALKKQLDDYFASALIQPLIANLYGATTVNKTLRAQAALELHGFIFIGGKSHVFTHTKFPGYVFKMALPLEHRTELLNASRIAYAEKLRALIAQKKLKIKIPQKWAYFIPRIISKNKALPALLVVAQKLNLANAKKELSKNLEQQVKVLESEGFIDVHDDNVMQCGDYAIIVDTEKHTHDTIAALHSPQKVTLNILAPFIANKKVDNDGFWYPLFEQGIQLKNNVIDFAWDQFDMAKHVFAG